MLGAASQGAGINLEHPEGVNALMYGAAGAHLGVVQVMVNDRVRPVSLSSSCACITRFDEKEVTRLGRVSTTRTVLEGGGQRSSSQRRLLASTAR